MSNEPVPYHYVSRPDVLVVMSPDGYMRFSSQVRPGGVIVIERDLVRLANIPEHRLVYGITAMRLAEELGNRNMMNIVMLGFFGAVAGVLNCEALRRAVESSVPRAVRELNLKAYKDGYEYGLQHAVSGPLTLAASQDKCGKCAHGSSG